MSFISRQTTQQLHLRDFFRVHAPTLPTVHGISSTVGFQRNEMKIWEVLTADDFSLQSIGRR